MLPSLLIRSILPRRLLSVWAFDDTAFSPTATYNLPSGPKFIAPPLWLVALRFSRSISTTSLPAATTSPLAVRRLIRL